MYSAVQPAQVLASCSYGYMHYYARKAHLMASGYLALPMMTSSSTSGNCHCPEPGVLSIG